MSTSSLSTSSLSTASLSTSSLSTSSLSTASLSTASLKELRKQVNDLKAENERIKVAAINLQWLARRYADGRMTYAVSDCNAATRLLLELGVELRPDPVGNTIWAKDGMESCEELSPEHYEAGHPIATGHVIGFPPGHHIARELESVIGTDLHYATLKVVRLKGLAQQLGKLKASNGLSGTGFELERLLTNNPALKQAWELWEEVSGK